MATARANSSLAALEFPWPAVQRIAVSGSENNQARHPAMPGAVGDAHQHRPGPAGVRALPCWGVLCLFTGVVKIMPVLAR